VHSAPSVGVRDWSDLRIAVAAGAWLASARPADVIDIVSDDRAFDAVGDVAASLGITYRRLSYRALAGAPAEELTLPVGERGEPHPRPHGGDGRHRGRRRGRRGHGGGTPAHAAPHSAPPPPAVPAGDAAHAGEAPHTAPHDEIVAVVRDLMRAAADRPVTIDIVANTLKSRGFSRPPGSPRLITRLRRIKEIEVSRSGMITLSGAAAEPAEPERDEPPPRETVATVDREDSPADDDAPEPGNEKFARAVPGVAVPGARRRRRRGGRRRGGRGRGQPVP